MRTTNTGDKISAGERFTARLLRYAPWLVFLLFTLPLPLYFALRRLTATEEPGVYVLLALTSLAAGALAGLLAALFVVLYRRSWERRMRERLAADGITAAELPWFTSELTKEEKQRLELMDARHPLLADAYRETLAARLTAAHVISRTQRETAAVRERLLNAGRLPDSSRHELERELRRDVERLERTSREAEAHRAALDARLQTIEALAGRDASEEETRVALFRLDVAREHAPLGLSSVAAEREAFDEVHGELRETGGTKDA